MFHFEWSSDHVVRVRVHSERERRPVAFRPVVVVGGQHFDHFPGGHVLGQYGPVIPKEFRRVVVDVLDDHREGSSGSFRRHAVVDGQNFHLKRAVKREKRRHWLRGNWNPGRQTCGTEKELSTRRRKHGRAVFLKQNGIQKIRSEQSERTNFFLLVVRPMPESFRQYALTTHLSLWPGSYGVEER